MRFFVPLAHHHRPRRAPNRSPNRGGPGARLAWAGMLLLAGCPDLSFDLGPGPGVAEYKDGQEVAVGLVWNEGYQQEGEAPEVRWVEGEALNCLQRTSDIPGFLVFGVCLGGLTFSGDHVSVGYRTDNCFSDTQLAHELYHARQFREGVSDPQHLTPGFQPLASCEEGADPECGIVERARNALFDAGL